ncbi:MAG: PRTRC system ThiF family protein [Sphingobacterium sp.]|jgi:PRTRC genetic system ThiF family protein|uniref:PRTRC system ThiF family protein n=1 Tax=Sphingobacterium sp. TaxID=341027 RepID=UPI00284B435B|nr:PRTRC system ThiF family protein [Sphingobacterium sp.]MDR3008642.1 PRTRC system ThiF family protein [Sphingobacterium sp.]
MISLEHKQRLHFLDSYLANPTNPLILHLIGAGGTGSAMLSSLARLQITLLAMGHPGFDLILWDDDVVTEFNIGRQLFSPAELGLPKSVALINRINRFMGFDWKAQVVKFPVLERLSNDQDLIGSIYITCVDNVKARFDLVHTIDNFLYSGFSRNTPRYWLDIGNSKDFGQAVLSTIGEVKQPDVSIGKTIAHLPSVIEEYGELLVNSEEQDDTPSCSIEDALKKQSLFINSTLALLATDILSDLFIYGKISERGFFLNLKNKTCQPLKV